MQWKSRLKNTIKISLPHILTIPKNEKTKFKVALENKNTYSFYYVDESSMCKDNL